MTEHRMELQTFFQAHPKVAVAFSGGVDSVYLMYAALACGATARAYYVKTAFQPAFELDDAKRLCSQLGVTLTVLTADVLAVDGIADNPPDRCYACKRLLFTAIAAQAAADGFDTLLDGTNASDDASDRPGMRALNELAVRSPLRLCGLKKDEIRRRSREAGLFTWDKPAYACLATRIPTGERITAEKLSRTERTEDALRALGLRDFRVRTVRNMAKLQVAADEFPLIATQRARIAEILLREYDAALLDLEARNA